MAELPMIRIPLRNGKGVPRAYALIDERDEALAAHRWHLDSQGYPSRCVGSTRPRIHRVVMGLEPGDRRQVDHRNGDKLDNRRSNLRIVPDQAAQSQNVAVRAASGYRGVYLEKATGRWYGQVLHKGVHHLAGHHDTPEQAHEAVAALRARVLPYALDRQGPGR